VEYRRGAVAPGNDADLVVLSRDIVADGSTALLDARVLLTIVAGRVMYRAA
jgi:predicted amidohydrolase YtcJ